MQRTTAVPAAVPTLPDPATDTVGYIRVSKEEQAGETKTSLATQRAQITALAARLGRSLPPTAIFADPGVSGQTAEGRPAFMALVAFCEGHKRSRRSEGFVLVLNDSRFGRFHDPEEAAYWRITLQRLGWIVRYAENDDTTDPTVRTLMRAIGSSTASAYTAQLRANTTRGSRGAAAQGFWCGRAPIGYRRVATRNGQDPIVLPNGVRKADDQVTRLTLGPAEEVELVRWIFSSYASGAESLRSLALKLRKRQPDKRWSGPVVQKLLRNMTYLGHVIWGRRPGNERERRELGIRPESEWTVARAAHPAIIDQYLFDRVQQRLATNRRTLRSVVGGYSLSGLLTCAHCGVPYWGGGGSINYKDPSDLDRYRFYRHGQIDDPAECVGQRGTLKRRLVEPAVVEAVAAAVEKPVVRKAIADALDAALASRKRGATGRADRLQARQAQLRAEHARLVAAVSRGVLDDSDARDGLAKLRAEEADIAAQLEQVRFGDRAATRFRTERSELLAFASDFRSRASQVSGLALRELLRPWIASATVDRESHFIDLAIRKVPAAGPFLPSSHSAGDRFTVMRRGGTVKSEFTSAALTRSRLSFTAFVGRPTMVQLGRPRAASTSTTTS